MSPPPPANFDYKWFHPTIGSTPAGVSFSAVNQEDFTISVAADVAPGEEFLITSGIDIVGGDRLRLPALTIRIVAAVLNNLPTGLPFITGSAQPNRGQTLTADTSGIDDLDGLGTFRYQWNTRVGTTDTAINGATSRAYTLTQAEVGETITVTVSYTDAGGTPESVTSSATIPVSNNNGLPVAVIAPLDSGLLITEGSVTALDEDVDVGLDGSGSFDPGGGTLTYIWEGSIFPAFTPIEFVGVNTATPSFTTPARDSEVTTLLFSLTVVDSDGNTDVAFVEYRVLPVSINPNRLLMLAPTRS